MRVLGRQPGYTSTAQPLSCWPTALARRTSTPPCSRRPGLLRSSYMMLPGRILDEQEQFYLFFLPCSGTGLPCDRAHL